MDKPQLLVHIEKQLNYTIYDVKWIPCSAKLIVIGSKPNGTGIIDIFELNSGELEGVKSVEKLNSLKCASFGVSSLKNTHLALGDFTGNLEIADLERNVTPVYTVKAHEDLINSMDCIGGSTINCGQPEIVTGSRDGSVKLWDIRQRDTPVLCISPLKQEEGGTGSRDCWAVAFGNSYNNTERVIGTGYDNGDLKLFDLRFKKVLWETNLKNGICSVEFDRSDMKLNKMVVTTLEGGLYVYDMTTKHPDKGFSYIHESNAGSALGSHGCITGKKSTVWMARHLPQNRDIFVTGGGAGTIRLWEYIYPEKRFKDDGNGFNVGVMGELKLLNGVTISTQPINCFHWSESHTGLGVCGSFDQTIRVLLTTKKNFN